MQRREPLTPSECWDLLTTATLGRIALSVRALPTILPVQYRVDDRVLAICLCDHDVPLKSIDGTVVAFSVDSLDHASMSGWTVQAHGVARLPTQHPNGFDCGNPIDAQIVHLIPKGVGGHRFNLCPVSSGS